MLDKILHTKLSSGAWTVVLFCLIAVAFVTARYFASRGAAMLSNSDPDPFWARNPHLEFVDRFPNTAFRIVKDRPSGRTFFLDLSPTSNSVVRLRSCDTGSHDPALVHPAATSVTCFDVEKPEGAGVPYVAGASYSVQAKQSYVAKFYRSVFESRGHKATVMQDSSRAAILEAESAGGTVARMSVRESFGTAQVFAVWVKK